MTSPTVPPPPTPPIKPDSDDCCRSGCIPCIFDLYADEYARYQQALREWQQRYASPASGSPTDDPAK